MAKIDIYYRAFKEYRKETIHDNVCERDRNELSQNNTENDVLEATKYLCHIEDDWVKAIEEGLEFVEKAVAEERQFIRTEGEVVEIEKVKKISKDSVEHLARHSEMITHVPENEGDTLVPDKLYRVEKLSDYAVYENRFLYMMLCYLRDFINYRLEKIEDLRRSYLGNMAISKEIVSGKRKLTFETKIIDDRKDNPYPIKDTASEKIIQRIKNCSQIITALLNTNLMVQVAKSPMIKPPITKTNVLKMNNNFKRSLALYDYIASYRGEGYTFEEVKLNFAPFEEKVADEIAEFAELASFIAYKTGNEIEDLLERNYLEEEERRKAEEARKLAEKIKRLKKRALESNKTLEEYMLLLEQRNKMLEKDSEELAVIKHEVELLNRKIDELNQEKQELTRQIENLEAAIEEKIREIAYLNQKYIEDMAALRKEHEIHVAQINSEHEQQVALINQQHEQEVDQINANHNQEITNLNLKHQNDIIKAKEEVALQYQATIDKHEREINKLHEQLDDFKVKHEEMVEDYDNKVLVLNEKIKGLNTEQKKLVKDYEFRLKVLETTYKDTLTTQMNESKATISSLENQNAFVKAQLDAIRVQHGQLAPSIDYASRERFVELEQEFKAFKKFFKDQWKVTKKEIRKNVLWSKEETQETSEVENKIEESRVVEDEMINKQQLPETEVQVNESPIEEVVEQITPVEEVIEAKEDAPIEKEIVEEQEVQEEVKVKKTRGRKPKSQENSEQEK